MKKVTKHFTLFSINIDIKIQIIKKYYKSQFFLSPSTTRHTLILTRYCMIAALTGFYKMQYMQRIKPKFGQTTVRRLNLNIGYVTVLTSAFPVVFRVLGEHKYLCRLNYLRRFNHTVSNLFLAIILHEMRYFWHFDRSDVIRPHRHVQIRELHRERPHAHFLQSYIHDHHDETIYRIVSTDSLRLQRHLQRSQKAFQEWEISSKTRWKFADDV